MFAVAGAKADERETLLDLLAAEPQLIADFRSPSLPVASAPAAIRSAAAQIVSNRGLAERISRAAT